MSVGVAVFMMQKKVSKKEGTRDQKKKRDVKDIQAMTLP